ncbi:hypothetical protein, partial [Actinokineospora sp.]|uniref:hypothetical protein n=1 Tax=Actinokineospora sp. TaxID=1872133 RepID=UPI003D6BE89B
MTGASPYRVRVALAELANQETSSGADVTSTGENDAGDAPDRQDNAEHAIAATAPLTVVDPPADAEAPKPTEALRQPAAVVAPAPAGGGRFVAWAGFVFGSVMSVAANVLHTWLPADRLPQGWAPGIAAQVGAAVWPIGLLLSVEVLSRVPWRPGWQWGLARFGGTGTVALGSAVISYGYVRDVLAAWGYDPVAAHVGPLVLDGLMVISGFALLT